MPDFRKLSAEEVSSLTRRRTNIADLREYLDYLKSLKDGDWGSIELGPDEVQRTVKRRMSTAASSVGKKIRWRTGRADRGAIIFQVLSGK